MLIGRESSRTARKCGVDRRWSAFIALITRRTHCRGGPAERTRLKIPPRLVKHLGIAESAGRAGRRQRVRRHEPRELQNHLLYKFLIDMSYRGQPPPPEGGGLGAKPKPRLIRVSEREVSSRNRYVEYRFKIDVRMLPQSGPLEGKAADKPGGRHETGLAQTPSTQHSRGETAREGSVERPVRANLGYRF